MPTAKTTEPAITAADQRVAKIHQKNTEEVNTGLSY